MKRKSVKNFYRGSYLLSSILIIGALQANSQLPDDIQRELNQNLAEQARQQQLQQQINQLHQQQRHGATRQTTQPVAAPRTSGGGVQDPNNYSFNQVAPPIQYSYYRPYGDNQPQQQQQQVAPIQQNYPNHQPQQQQQQQQFLGNDFSGFGLNQPSIQQPLNNYYGQQQQQQQNHQAPPVPNFTGAGGLPNFQGGQLPAQQYQNPNGGTPVQQGPPLTENDFKDITEGQNYGAPGGSDFGLGNVDQNGGQATGTSTDDQLREFGLSGNPNAPARTGSGGNGASIPNLGSLGGSGGGGGDPDLGSFCWIGATCCCCCCG